MKKREVQASVKDERLVQKRRDQMIKGAVTLFKQKGFHRTTTREIAKAAGFSIGTLYEYIRTKEDVLYLVCDSIYDHVSDRLQKDLALKKGTLESLKLGIANFFQVMDEIGGSARDVSGSEVLVQGCPSVCVEKRDGNGGNV